MGIWYIKKMESIEEIVKPNLPQIVKKMIASIKIHFCLPTVKEVENRTIVILPVLKGDEIKEKKQEKLASKITKRLYDKTNQDLVLAKELELPFFKNCFYSRNCHILDGRWLFQYLLPQTVEYIAEQKEEILQRLEVSMMINDNRESSLKTIILLAQKVKMLNIVTNELEKFKKIEEYLYENLGIVIRITNNRKKALLKSEIILNMDFPEELLNQYVIPKKAIIVNISEKVTIFSKRFSGINCNYYQISLPEPYKNWFAENNIHQDFDEAILYESMLYRKNSYDNIIKEIAENETKIQYLIGNKGKIREEEYKVS